MLLTKIIFFRHPPAPSSVIRRLDRRISFLFGEPAGLLPCKQKTLARQHPAAFRLPVHSGSRPAHSPHGPRQLIKGANPPPVTPCAHKPLSVFVLTAKYTGPGGRLMPTSLRSKGKRAQPPARPTHRPPRFLRDEQSADNQQELKSVVLIMNTTVFVKRFILTSSSSRFHQPPPPGQLPLLSATSSPLASPPKLESGGRS